MSGPFVLALASVPGREARIAAARKIAKAGVENNIGLVFRADLVDSILGPHYPGFVKEMTDHIRDPIVFLVTEHPLENDLFDLFAKELNPAVADPAKSRILKFLKAIYSIKEIREFLFALWDWISPSWEDLPKYEMPFDEFYKWVKNWYGWEQPSRKQIKHSEGIFTVRRHE